MTDNTQASEDELLKTLLDKLAIIKYGEAYKWLFDVDKSNVDMWTKDLLAIIRTQELEARIDALEYAKISPKFKIEERIEALKQEGNYKDKGAKL